MMFKIWSTNRHRSYSMFSIKESFLFLILSGLFLLCRSSMTMNPSKLELYMVRSPESTVAPLGDEVLFECELNVKPDQLEWRFRAQGTKGLKSDYVYLNETLGYNITYRDGVSKLRIYVSPKTVGEYQCIAWFGASALASVSSKLTLASIGLGNESKIFEQDDNGVGNLDNSARRRILPQQTVHWRVSPGNTVIVKCGDITSNPPPVWSFFKDNVMIPSNVPQLPSGAFILKSLSVTDSGTYWCSAVNSITGMEIKMPQRTVLMVNNTPKTSPNFLSQPAPFVAVKPGGTAILECPGIGNPVPKAVWSRPDGIIPKNRTTTLSYGLQIIDVVPEDRGTYVCRLDNGISPVLHTYVRLDVLEPPVIVEGPKATLTNESESLYLECHAKGYPPPDIFWMINGDNTQWDEGIQTNGSSLLIKAAEKRHAGIVQCFARNDVGEANEGNLLQVNPKQILGGSDTATLYQFPQSTRASVEHSGKTQKGGRKKHKPVMIPPSRPNVTRLTDESVMVRWDVPSEEGLPIQFFKVQYRMLSDPSKKVSRSTWKTCSEDIPPTLNVHEVKDLKPDNYYRFRIAAVYSNSDNKIGNTSGKFHLQKGSQLSPAKSHLVAPVLQKVEGVSETAIKLHWAFPNNPMTPVEGFYASFRKASTASEYSKATIDGMMIRQFILEHLEPGTAYEVKLQSFTSSAASEFSAILTGKTLKPPSKTPSVVAASESSQNSGSNMPLIAGAAGGGGLLLLAVILLCVYMKRRKKSQGDDEANESKSHPDHIQVEPNGFPGGDGRVMGSPIHKSSRLNGVVPRMNITPNPMAQEGDKNRNVMELRFLPNSMAVPPPVPMVQNNNCSTDVDVPHRRTLERSARSLHYGGNGTGGGSDSKSIGVPSSDPDTFRNPSTRRTRKTSGSGPGSPRVIRGGASSEILHRSPMPVRATNTGAKRGARLGNRAENMSSGSLNSIEV